MSNVYLATWYQAVKGESTLFSCLLSGFNFSYRRQSGQIGCRYIAPLARHFSFSRPIRRSCRKNRKILAFTGFSSSIGSHSRVSLVVEEDKTTTSKFIDIIIYSGLEFTINEHTSEARLAGYQILWAISLGATIQLPTVAGQGT